MSKFLNLMLNRETCILSVTEEKKDQIINRLKKILAEKGFKTNLTGKIINDNEFKLTDKWTIGIYIQGAGDPAYLTGKFNYELDRITMRIKAHSHFIFPLWTVLLPLVVIVATILNPSDNRMEMVGAIFFSFMISIILNKTGNFFKNRLLNKVLKEMTLNKGNVL
ncbi:MAG: hypothetical protein ACM3O8_10345 [Methylococcaceae bacterium]